ncbi:hypothetical protein DZF91_18785 [Actinomadura logoneensis]|uniref:Sulfotransferase family protein n=1 Tax=Actinomadura logoneensis TaxID=2293572 RepID=A0A372JJD7_9ACTN|nr:hypothetical protein [Actinomadura logoneensis]RFU40127.1 hypothetical protein DZF91_18785 [Actinomadura logoneensis]
MRPVVFLHVGAPKSGTTYLQNVLWANREALAEQGVLYPGADPVDHVRAAFDLRAAFFDGDRDPRVAGAWPRLVDEIRSWSGGVSVVSQELFGAAFPAHVRRAFADLSFADVRLVCTARDLARQIPAHWQEDVKNRMSLTFAEYIAGLAEPDVPRGPAWQWIREFWRTQDLPEMLRRWGAGTRVPADRVHVVTVPPAGAPPDLLFRRFCAATGIDAARCDTEGVFGNPSLGRAETAFLRRLNEVTRARVPWAVHDDFVKHRLAQGTLVRRPGATRIRLPERFLPWTVERAESMVAELRAAGYGVAGDLADLLPTVSGDGGSDPDQAPPEQVLDVALDSVAELLRTLHARESATARLEGAAGLDGLRRDVARMRSDAEHLLTVSAPVSTVVVAPVKRVVRDMSERNASVMRARVAYWHYVERRRGRRGQER